MATYYRCVKRPPGEWLTEGEVYRVSLNPGDSVRLWSEQRNAGTFMLWHA